MRLTKTAFCILLSVVSFSPSFAQVPETFSSADIYMQLKKLNVLGSVLYIAAHPDDENNGFLPYLAKEKMYRTGYLRNNSFLLRMNLALVRARQKH